MNQLVPIGRVIRPHGINGWVWVLPLTDGPERLLSLERLVIDWGARGEEERAVRDAKLGPKGVRLLIGGIEDRDAAETLRGKTLKAEPEEEEDLPPDTYYVSRLEGVRVETEEGEYLGDFKEVMPTGSNDVYIVRHPETNAEWMAPALKAAIVRIDLEKRLMVVRKEWIT